MAAAAAGGGGGGGGGGGPSSPLGSHQLSILLNATDEFLSSGDPSNLAPLWSLLDDISSSSSRGDSSSSMMDSDLECPEAVTLQELKVK